MPRSYANDVHTMREPKLVLEGARFNSAASLNQTGPCLPAADPFSCDLWAGIVIGMRHVIHDKK